MGIWLASLPEAFKPGMLGKSADKTLAVVASWVLLVSIVLQLEMAKCELKNDMLPGLMGRRDLMAKQFFQLYFNGAANV